MKCTGKERRALIEVLEGNPKTPEILKRYDVDRKALTEKLAEYAAPPAAANGNGK